MTLEDFEKSLAEGRRAEERYHDTEEREAKHRKHQHHHRHHHKRRHDQDDTQDRYKHKRARRSLSVDSTGKIKRQGNSSGKINEPHNGGVEQETPGGRGRERRSFPADDETEKLGGLQRDSWMESPLENDIEFTQRGVKNSSTPKISRASETDFKLKVHENELNKHHIQELTDAQAIRGEVLEESAQHEVSYVFGDTGSQWRMTKLKAVFRQAEESGKLVEDVAMDQFGNLRAFDDAREEQIELDRRHTYGPGYVGKEKPSGDLFAERKLDEGIRRRPSMAVNEVDNVNTSKPSIVDDRPSVSTTAILDHTALNRLKANMMKAKLRGAVDASSLEDEYNAALASSVITKEPDVVVLGMMDNRMLAGGRNGEVKSVDSKRGRERGLVEEKDDMSIDDMVREERRARHQLGGEGQRFAERIAKDGRYDVSLLSSSYLYLTDDLSEQS